MMYLDEARRESEAASSDGPEPSSPSGPKPGELDLFNMPAEQARAIIGAAGLGDQGLAPKLAGGLAAGWSETEAAAAVSKKRGGG